MVRGRIRIGTQASESYLCSALSYKNKKSTYKTELLGLRPEWAPNPLSWSLSSAHSSSWGVAWGPQFSTPLSFSPCHGSRGSGGAGKERAFQLSIWLVSYEEITQVKEEHWKWRDGSRWASRSSKVPNPPYLNLWWNHLFTHPWEVSSPFPVPCLDSPPVREPLNC